MAGVDVLQNMSAVLVNVLLKNARARRVLNVTAVAVATGIVIHLLAASGALGNIFDACAAEREHGNNERVRRADKAAQALYYKLYYFTFGVASVRLALFLPGRGKHLIAFGMLAAVVTHGLRLGLYFKAILPLGRLVDRTRCGTTKGVSGHTHMYATHTAYACWFVYVHVLRPHLAFATWRARQGLVAKNDKSAWEWVSNLIALPLILLAYVSCWQLSITYGHGYHSLRHVLYGLLAAAASVQLMVELTEAAYGAKLTTLIAAGAAHSMRADAIEARKAGVSQSELDAETKKIAEASAGLDAALAAAKRRAAEEDESKKAD